MFGRGLEEGPLGGASGGGGLCVKSVGGVGVAAMRMVAVLGEGESWVYVSGVGLRGVFLLVDGRLS